MKKLLTPILLISSMFCKAQIDSAWTIPITTVSSSAQPDKVEKDTIPIIMLGCDTSYYLNKMVYWFKGYEVRNKVTTYPGVKRNGIMVYYQYETESYYEHDSYLYFNKIPLLKSVVVWMSQKIQ